MPPTPDDTARTLDDLVCDPYFPWKLAYNCAMGELDITGRHRVADEIEQRTTTIAFEIERMPHGTAPATKVAFGEAAHVLNDLVNILRATD